MVYHLGFSSSKAISISLNELHNVNKDQLELINQRVKGRVNSASGVSIPILLTKRLQLLANSRERRRNQPRSGSVKDTLTEMMFAVSATELVI